MQPRTDHLRVLLYARADAASNPGGDVVEAEALRAGLAAAGHEAQLALDGRRVPGRWDVVHLLNLDRAPELGAFLAGHDGFPGAAVVLAPVLSDLPAAAPTLARKLRGVANLVRSSRRPSRAWLPGAGIAALGARVGGLHFHTEAERRAFGDAFPAWRCPSAVVPPPLWWPPATGEPAVPPPDPPFALAIGRIEPLKNQLWLLESGLTRVLPLVFVGAANPKRPRYLARFRRAVARDAAARWLGAISRERLRATLAAASLHVLASRHENYGLATVEALGSGCEALVPRHHPIASELGDALHTFDLARPASLLAAAREALGEAPRAPAFDPARHRLQAVTAAVLKLYGEVMARDVA